MSDTLNQLLQGQHNATVLQGIANPAQVNPLAAINSANQVAQQVFQTRGLQAQQALGNILQQSTDENGNVDYQDAQRRAAAAGPVVQMGMQSYLTNNAQLRGAQITQAGALHNLVGNMAASLMNDPSDENLAKIRAGAVASGLPGGALAEIDRIAALPPAQRGAEAYKHVQGQLDALGKLATAGYGTPESVDAGGVRVPVTTQPASPYAPASATVGGGGVALGLTPAQLAAPHNYVDANGVQHQTTVGEFLKTLGVPAPQGGGQAGGVPAGGSQPPRGAVAPQPPPAPQTTTGKSIPAPEPGQAAQWDASTKQYTADNADAGTYQQRIFPLVQAASILKSGNVTTGAGAEALNSIKSHLMTFASTLGADAQTIQQADFDKTAKYMQQYVNQQGLSGRSDQAMASAISGNPSAHISTLANQQILPVMIGMERMKQMIVSDFTNSGGKPKDYADYKTNWQNTHDPRAFIFDMMDPDQRAKMVAGMTPSQKLAFSRSLDLVERNPGIMGQAAMPGH